MPWNMMHVIRHSVYINAIEGAVLMHQSLPVPLCTAYSSSSARPALQHTTPVTQCIPHHAALQLI